MLIGTAGHVDHGKTTLVRALTGTDTDRLAEEKRRGMTIDLGYAYAGALAFIDVPGHERFVHTMLAGSGGIDAALLVVAADDGVMPQTREHAQILWLLGIAQGVVAITRVDRAPGRVSGVTAEVRALLRDTPLEDAAVLEVCAPSGDGMAALRSTLLALGKRPRDKAGYPRLAVDRAFAIAGSGLVVTGTLVAGCIAINDRLQLSPSGIAVRVRGLHADNRAAEHATAGQRVALNLAGAAKHEVARGDWVLHPDVHAPTALLDVRVRTLPEAPALRANTPVHLHLAAAHVIARAHPLGPESGGEILVRLALDRPIGALTGDRLVLRDAAAARTIGGGVVLDPWPPRRGSRTPARLQELDALDQPAPEALRCLVDAGWVDFSAFARARNLQAAQRSAVLKEAGAVLAAGVALRGERMDALRNTLRETLAAHHRSHEDEPGLTPERLRAMLPSRIPPALFGALLDSALRDREMEQDGPWLRLPTHRPALSARDEEVWQAARRLIEAERFRPPRTRDLAAALKLPETAMRSTLKRLSRMGRLAEVAHDQFFLRETVAELAGIAAAAERQEGVVTAAGLRDRLGNGRKVAIQILEFFDRAGLTRRRGDERRVVHERLSRFGQTSDR